MLPRHAIPPCVRETFFSTSSSKGAGQVRGSRWGHTIARSSSKCKLTQPIWAGSHKNEKFKNKTSVEAPPGETQRTEAAPCYVVRAKPGGRMALVIINLVLFSIVSLWERLCHCSWKRRSGAARRWPLMNQTNPGRLFSRTGATQ